MRIKEAVKHSLITLGGNHGRKIVRKIICHRAPPILAIPWAEIKESEKGNIFDNNVPLNGDDYCPICDQSGSFDLLIDQVRSIEDVPSRKILYQCQQCKFLFTNEPGMNETYFTLSPYIYDKTGLGTQREIDCVHLGRKVIQGRNDSNILVYAIGKTEVIRKLNDAGFDNVWGSDISDDIEYGPKVINIRENHDYFLNANIKFDIVVCTEVWEHYQRRDINGAFHWLFKNLSKDGIVIGTTSLWLATKSDDFNYNLSNEWGIGQIKRWRYPHPLDHHSFYRADNLKRIAERFKMFASIAYFTDPKVHYEDPFKRVIAFVHRDNDKSIVNLKQLFEGKYHNIFYY